MDDEVEMEVKEWKAYRNVLVDYRTEYVRLVYDSPESIVLTLHSTPDCLPEMRLPFDGRYRLWKRQCESMQLLMKPFDDRLVVKFGHEYELLYAEHEHAVGGRPLMEFHLKKAMLAFVFTDYLSEVE